MLDHAPYRGVRLTPAGERVALEVIRHHRLLELYLAETLGLDVDDVHDEADRLEHVLSEELEARIDRALGFPTHDPHGDPIPNAALEWPKSVPASGRRTSAREARGAPPREPLDGRNAAVLCRDARVVLERGVRAFEGVLELVALEDVVVGVRLLAAPVPWD